MSFFSIAEFPYGNEAFSMVVLLPAEGKTLNESLEGLTYDNWKLWNEQPVLSSLSVKFPHFELKYKKDLIKDMKAMGMVDAFNCDKADFSALSPAELFIGLLDQHTYIKVDEEGTEAAAVTIVGLNLTSAGPSHPVDFHIDRPFVFMIKEKSTGTILFMGKITKLYYYQNSTVIPKVGISVPLSCFKYFILYFCSARGAEGFSISPVLINTSGCFNLLAITFCKSI